MAARIFPSCAIWLNRVLCADLDAADSWLCSALSAARATGIPLSTAFRVASMDALELVPPLSSQR